MATFSTEDFLLTANTIRGLSMDGVQAANSGHPGMPMGMADIAAVLFLKHLKHCPGMPSWEDRDRFVLSAGHGSMLLYSLLHLSGYDLSLDELRRFRQLGSATPGHPEWGHTPGVETTTGPLGQGIGNAVGMALAERMLAARFNTADETLFDHHTYAFCGDGDMMEGLSHEACSLAGHLGLNRLIVFYDSNGITIEGHTDLAYSDNVRRRFAGYRWNVIDNVDGHNYKAIDRAIVKAKRFHNAPTLIIAKTHIGKGSPNKQDTHEVHGAPLGAEEIRLTKQALGLPIDDAFHVPSAVRALFQSVEKRMTRAAQRWMKKLTDALNRSPAKAKLWREHMENALPEDLYSIVPSFPHDKSVATRSASGKVIQKLAAALPSFVGGSADLAPSTKTLIDQAASIAPGFFSGRNFHFGIREHGMCALLNGMALHGGFRVFGATFFVFLDYCRPAVRLAALMKLPVIYVFTHDSFYVGEDGPTHQPVEHLASLRCIPNVTVIRPAEATETAAAWIAALKNQDGPTALVLTRQDIPVIDRAVYPSATNLEKGAYTLWQNGNGTPDILLMASGSETGLALAAAKRMATHCNVRVVSMPSWELFEKQSAAYRSLILPPECAKRVAIEAGSSFGWERYVGPQGRLVTLDRFGASGPYQALEKAFGFTVENVVEVASSLLR